MRKSKKLTLIAVIAVLIVGGGGVATYAYLNQNDDNPKTGQQESSDVNVVSTDSGKTLTYKGQNGKSALDLIKSGADVKTEVFTYGEMVSSINGVEAGSSQFWGFYVDGEMAPVGAADYITKDGEEITWQLEDIE